MPPVVTKQSVKPAAKPPPAPTGSAWDTADTVRMLLYGQSGTGKTTLWATFPGPILCLICSGGNKPGELRSINTPEYREKITPKVITSSLDFEREVANAGDYATVVLDHASGFADMKLAEIIGKPVPAQKGWGLASQQQYGQLGLQCKENFRTLLNCPGHIVIVAQERVFGGKEDGGDPDLVKPTIGAALTPSLTGWLNPACDFVVQTFKRPVTETRETNIAGTIHKTEVRGKGVQYALRTGPSDLFMTKFRLPRGIELPEYVVDPTFDSIQALISGDE